MTSSVTDLCRLCGTDTFNIVRHHIFEAEGLAKDIAKKIADCLPVTVTPQDRLPKHMCGECAYKLDLLSEFRDKAVKTEHLLESLVDGVKPEILENEEPDNDLGADDGFRSDSPDQQEPEVLIKEEEAEARPERRPVRKAARKVGRPRGRKRKQTEVEPDTEEEESEEAPKKAAKKEEAPAKVYRKRGRKPKNNKESPGLRFQIPTTSASGRSLRRSAHIAMRSISKFAKYDEKVDKELELHPVKTPIFPDENKEASAWDNRHECCSVCKLYVGDRPMMEEHIRQKHPEELICKICNEVQSTVEHLKKHEAQHKSGYLAKKAAFVPYVKVRLDNGKVVRRQRCPTCNKLVSRLKRHIVVEHTKDYKFSCSECDRKFPLEEDLTKHIKIQHLNDFPFLCVECGKGFKCKTLLTTHERRHRGEKFVFCDICGTGFYSKSVLVVHLVDRHINTAREHPCDVCGKMFKKRAAVRHHRIRHFEENKRFECDFCSERFFKKCLLLYHVKIAHTLERPYECDICGKGFILRSLMTQHAIRHMDIKMHQCHLCPNSYRWPRNLSRHLIAVHSNQLAKFMCDLCGEEFLTELSMMNHKIKKHPTPNQFLVDPEDMQESNNAGNELLNESQNIADNEQNIFIV